MAIVLTFQEIARWRSELFEYPESLKALDEIENCDGDLEDASISLAIHAGQEPTTSDRWLEGLAKRYRSAICQNTLKEALLKGHWAKVVGDLLAEDICPPILVTPVVIYVAKVGVTQFCEPLDYQIHSDS